MMVREGLTVNDNTMCRMKDGFKRVLWCAVIGVLLCAMPLLRGSASATDVNEVKGNIINDTVWTTALSHYQVTGNITVAEGVTLRIEQGVTVEFKKVAEASEGYHIQVHGTLDAQGAEGKPILFTTEEKGWYWGHIEFTEESEPWDDANATGCILSGCIIEYAGNGAAGGYSKASVRCISASPLITDCIVRYSSTDGILCRAGVPNIVDNRIHDTVCGIKLINPEGGRVENNYLIENGQGIYVDSGAGTLSIQNNTIRGTEPEIYGACMGVKLSFQTNLESYLWEQIDGNSVVLTDANTAYSTFNAPDVSADETLTFQLTVTDRDGLLASDTVNVLVRGENEAPEAYAGPDQTVFEGEMVMLDGSNSFDPDGSVLTYAWEQTSGPAVTLFDPNSEYCIFTAPLVDPNKPWELCIFELLVTDSGGLRSWGDTVVIRVEKDTSNALPVADAGAELSVNEGSTVTLDGSGSYDPEGEGISWFWEQIEGPSVAISNDTSALASFTAPEVGWGGQALTFQLTVVTDETLQESSDTVIVNVLDSDPNDRNNPPHADANDVVVNEGTGVTVNLDGIVSDPDGSAETEIDAYNWEQVSGRTVTINNETHEDCSFTAPDVTKDEVLVFRFTITDDHGLKSSATVEVVINWVNEPPVANAGADQTVVEGVKVLLYGSASDPDDNIASYLWEQPGGTAVTLSSTAVPRPFFTAPAVDTDALLRFRLTVHDGEGASSQDDVSVTVTGVNMQPKADAGENRAVQKGSMVYLDGSGSYDPDDPNNPNGIVAHLWEQDPNVGQHVTLYDADTATPHFEAPSLSDPNAPPFVSLVFSLTVWDAGDRDATDSVIINVTADPNGNRIPAVEAGPDQTVAARAVATLDGAGSFDPDYPCEIGVNMNSLVCDDPNQIGNLMAIAKNTSANCLLDVTSNNLDTTSGNFTVYLFNWAPEDSQVLDMSGNWWGDSSSSAIEAMIYDADSDAHLPQVDASSPQGSAITGAGSSLSYPPMADAGEEQTASPDESITLDASGTYDPDGIFTYRWEQVEGKDVTLADAGGISAFFVAPAPEEVEDDGEETPNLLTFKLTVTDARGFSDTDEVTVTLEEGDEKAALRESSGCFISILHNTHDLSITTKDERF